MSLKKKILLLLSLPMLLGVLAVVSVYESDDPTRLTASTYSTGPKGTKALYLVLEELDLRVKRYRRPFNELASRNGTLVIYDPKAVPVTKREVNNLTKWIAEGNSVIIVESSSTPLLRISFNDKRNSITERKETFSLSRHFGISLYTSHNKERNNFHVQIPNCPEELTVTISNEFRWRQPFSEWSTILKDDLGAILIVKEIGKGQVIALSDPGIFSNEHIKEEQNLRLALALLLQNGKPREILFDEYHHGHVLEASFWGYVWSSPFSWILVQLVIGVALLIYSRRASQSGRFRTLYRQKGRSSLEYVYSMANIFESSNASSLALEAIMTRFTRQYAKIFGLPATLLEEHLTKTVDKSNSPLELIRECRSAISKGDDPRRNLALARSLAEIREKILLPKLKIRGKFNFNMTH